MKDVYDNLKEEVIEKYGEKEWENINEIIEMFWFKGDDISKLGELNGWYISESKEKINALQYNHEFNLSKDDMHVSLLFENGINNGTQLNEYSLSGDHLIPRTRTIEIIDDLIFDSKTCESNGFNAVVAEIKLNTEMKSKILKLYKDSNMTLM